MHACPHCTRRPHYWHALPQPLRPPRLRLPSYPPPHPPTHGNVHNTTTHSARMVEKALGVEGDDILYVGDHIYTDAALAKINFR